MAKQEQVVKNSVHSFFTQWTESSTDKIYKDKI